MEIKRAIQLLEVEKEYALKQSGFHQKPINKEVAKACDMGIEALKQMSKIVYCCNCVSKTLIDTNDGNTLLMCDVWGGWRDPMDYCFVGSKGEDNED